MLSEMNLLIQVSIFWEKVEQRQADLKQLRLGGLDLVVAKKLWDIRNLNIYIMGLNKEGNLKS